MWWIDGDIEEIQSSRFLRGVAKVGHVSILVAYVALGLVAVTLVGGALVLGIWDALS